MIYENVFGGKSLYIRELDRRLQHRKMKLVQRLVIGLDETYTSLPLWKTTKDRDLLPIMLTCRQA